MASNTRHCYHCGEVVPTNIKLQVDILGQQRDMCCHGCAAVAETIIDSGLTDYYKHRTNNAPSAQGLVPSELQQLLQYDQAELQDEFVAQQDDYKEVLLSLDNVSCAACAWLIERHLSAISGVISIKVNATTLRASLRWDDQHVKLSHLLQACYKLGYHAAPFQADQQELADKKRYRSYLLRLGLAGLATMQVMMFAIALYGNFFTDMDELYRNYFRWVSLIAATPVLLYSAQPFYVAAYKSIRHLSLSMDVPVTIALLAAYSASCYATITGSGEVYFESVCMFTFLLLLGRMLEIRARRKASETSSNLLKLVPNIATKMTADGELINLPASQLKPGDIIFVKPGETLAADGIIREGHSQFDESMLTGESLPVTKSEGDVVYAGTINHQQNIKLSVTGVAQNTFVANIIRMQEQAQNEKPQIASIADKLARHFVLAVLVIALVTYLVWLQISPQDAFWITLAVLVSTCPCALSLATPAALTSATHHLSKLGLLIKRGHVLEHLAQLEEVVSDKTGTLTKGELQLIKVEATGQLSSEQALNFAAALEQYSSHPIAKAFPNSTLTLSQVQHVSGVGINGHYGTNVLSLCQAQTEIDNPQQSLILELYCDQQLCARFFLADKLKDDAIDFSQSLKQRMIRLSMLTGDSSAQVNLVADKLGISERHSGLLPQDKLTVLRTKLKQQSHIAMLGDGVNDSPVLAAAPLSIAMGLGTDIAKSSADAVLINSKLYTLITAIDLAKKTRRIIKQNLGWALGYNALILPLAVSGQVTPYIAALGMSLSSLIVLSNSLRLSKK